MRVWLVRSGQRTELSSPPQTAVEPEPPQMMEFRISPDGFRGASSCGSPADGSALIVPAPAPPRPPWFVGGLLRKRASQLAGGITSTGMSAASGAAAGAGHTKAAAWRESFRTTTSAEGMRGAVPSPRVGATCRSVSLLVKVYTDSPSKALFRQPEFDVGENTQNGAGGGASDSRDADA